MTDISANTVKRARFSFESGAGAYGQRTDWIGFTNSQSDCPDGHNGVGPVWYLETDDESDNGKYVCGFASDGTSSAHVVSTNPISVDSKKPVLGPANAISRNIPTGQSVVVLSLTGHVTATDSVDPNPRVEYKINGAVVTGSHTFPLGETAVSVRAIDHVDRKSDSKAFTVTVKDNEKPSISTPANTTIPTDPGQQTASYDVSSSATATDIVDPNPTVSYWLGSTQITGQHNFSLGSNNVRVEAVDSSGNKAITSFQVIVEDREIPVILDVRDVTLNTDAGQPTATYNPTLIGRASDNVASGLTITHLIGSTPVTGLYAFSIGRTTVTVTAQDTSGNTAVQESFDVHVTDDEAPIITVPSTQIRDAVPPLQTAEVDVTSLVNISDNSGFYSSRYLWGTTELTGPFDFPIGDNLILITATDGDGDGNIADQQQFIVRVRDIELPVITPPSDIVLDVATGDTSVSRDVTTLGQIRDNHSSNLSIIFRIGTSVFNGLYSFPLGVTVVTMDATDDAGNDALRQSFQVTVQDLVAPDMPLEPDITFTDDDAIHVTGLAERNAQIVVRFPKGDSAKAKADANGRYAVVSQIGQTNGKVSIQAIDAANNLSPVRYVDVVVRGDPIRVSLSALPKQVAGATSHILEVTFSQSITGFEPSDFVSKNAGVEILSANADNSVFKVKVTTSGVGDVELFLPEGRVDGLLRNTNLASNIVISADKTKQTTEEQITKFMQERATLLLSRQPKLTAFIKKKTKTPELKAGPAGTIGKLTADQPFNLPIWTQLSGNLTFSGGGESLYLFSAIGMHGYMQPNLIVGGMLELDYLERKEGQATTSGVGWLAGPYFGAQLFEQPLYMEGKALFGQTFNHISPGGSYSDAFTTTRLLAQIQLSGSLRAYQVDWVPFVDASYLMDVADGYKDTPGNEISKQDIMVSQVQTGLEFEKEMTIFDGKFAINGGVSGIWSASTGTAATVVPSYEGWRASTKLGFIYSSQDSHEIKFDAEYDGIGVDDYESFSLNLQLTRKF
ncbi:Ig-like domain-containing protein [Pseudovibrio sp. Tun.PSC04-5.I4]|uniref:Ig-like domain-containing protein n=1 Tax=Pseudovibrio sp. Tun.PSC04-5.I4 TaxID=1798213 RepID=UPI00117BA1BF|nr:Ig-like domain-containing protein [Pseudovibrio sp. Tun.PSC04-5.I4]